jgi:hypothetical protein
VDDAPVPQERGGGRAEYRPLMASAIQAVQAYVGEGRRRTRAWVRAQQPGTQHPDNQHRGSGENGVGRHHQRAVRLHQLFAEQNPGQRGDQRGQDQQISGERRLAVQRLGAWLPPRTISAAPTVEPQRASQPKRSSRSLWQTSAAAAASSTGMAPTISEAWLTVVRARP